MFRKVAISGNFVNLNLDVSQNCDIGLGMKLKQAALFEDEDEVPTKPLASLSPLEMFRQLNQNEKDYLITIAARDGFRNKTDITEALQKAGLRNLALKTFSGSDGIAALEMLRHKGLISPDKYLWEVAGGRSSLFLGLAMAQPDYCERAKAILTALRDQYARSRYSFQFSSSNSSGLVLARCAYYLGDMEALEKFVFPQSSWMESVSLRFIFYPFNPAFFSQLPKLLKSVALTYGVQICFDDIICPERLFGENLNYGASTGYFRLMGDVFLLKGDHKALKKWADRYREWGAGLDEEQKISAASDPIGWEASQLVQKGDIEGAIAKFEECLNIIRGDSRKKKLVPRGLAGWFFQVALILRNQGDDLSRAIQLGEWGIDLNETSRAHLLQFGKSFGTCLIGRQEEIANVIRFGNSRSLAQQPNFESFCFALMARLSESDRELINPWIEKLNQLTDICQDKGFSWLAWQAKSLAVALMDAPESGEMYALGKLKANLDFKPGPSFAEALTPPEKWEMQMTALEEIVRRHGSSTTKKSSKNAGTAKKEVIWIFHYVDEEGGTFTIYPAIRTVSPRGIPGKSKKISLKKLNEAPEEFPELTEQDRRATRLISKIQGWGGHVVYSLTSSRTLVELAGHPLVFSENKPGDLNPLKISIGRFQIDVSENTKGGVVATLKPAWNPSDKYGMVVKENPSEFTVYELLPEVVGLSEVLGEKNKITLPTAAKDRFFSVVSNLAGKIDVAADGKSSKGLAGVESADGDLIQVKGDSRLRLRLFPDGEGLLAQLVVQPIDQCDHRFAPGEGRETIFGIAEGKRTQASRDLKTEAKNARWLIENCPSLEMKRGELRDLWSWKFDTPVDCLDLLKDLMEMPEAKNHEVIVEWPENQPFKLKGIISAVNFTGSLGSSGDWLTISGEFKVNDNLVLTMRELLDAATPDAFQGGFLKLGQGEFIALTENFSRQLEDLRALSQNGKNGQINLPPLAALALEDFVEETGAKVKDKAWKEWLERIKGAQDHSPDAPRNLQADLRPYQLDGYRWLSRLAKSGAGACLADDMGLGKTVQTLSLLLERAASGPALVIAPTSVAANWFDECLKFAPTLNAIIFGSGDRAKQLSAAKPYDLVICTYGLLQRECEALGEIQWHTVVLDEAQAIKNSSTQRSKAALDLKADFRIVTTGTPVENRLSELHTLFQFALPGYLGNWEKFRRTFADPIEKHQDRAARDRLRHLIQPFMLRRLKSGVLKDLPSRTEVNFHVELNEEQTAFYEALRQKAIDEVESQSSDDDPGKKAFQILAQLTKLRRACCHPSLADKKIGAMIGSAKLEAFSETISDIIAGNHKVLVFSQFVDHLSLIRTEIERLGFTYQYLDGSTTVPKRRAAVEAFQRGESDVFLISLKAGGFGLNLTAADYVIHMDPWWNPATEDQASDRAHRIGQTRPVTIYRFITKNTIEEKIVALHHKKRELAESLLTGTDIADSKMSPEELMKLLREE